MGKIHSVHDTFVRAILSDSGMAADYFRSALPAALAGKLDFSTLQRQPDSYVSGALQETFSDSVYACQRSDGKGSVEMSLLVEHKSAPDKYMPLQVGAYLFSGYQQQVDQGRQQLTPIIPVLLYHGEDGWKYRTLQGLFGELDSELLAYVPDFEYVYHDLRGTPDEDLEALGNRYLMVSLLLLKHTFDGLWLQGNFSGLLAVGLPQASGKLQRAMLTYYFERVEFTKEQVKEVIREIPTDIQEVVMSTYELLIEEGRKQERAKAEAKNHNIVAKLIQQLGLDDEAAAGVAEVSADFVRKVRSDLGKKKK